MPSIEAVRASNAAFEHPEDHPPVAIFVGGTSGVGQGMAEVFARNTHGRSHIVLVGRNRTGAEKILSQMPNPDPGHFSREFLYCDLTHLKNVQILTQDILSKYPKINYLVITAGFMALGGRNETEEGNDRKLAVHYYSRWKLIHDLIPALKKAKEGGEPASVMSVLAAGKGAAIDVIHRMDDLAVKDGYWMMKLSLLAPTYNDLMLEVCSALAFSLRLFNDLSYSLSLRWNQTSHLFTHTQALCVRRSWRLLLRGSSEPSPPPSLR